MRSDTLTAAVMVVLTLGVCFSMLITGLEAAIGGDVSQAVEVLPTLAGVAVAFAFGRGTGEASGVAESASEQQATEL